jgi:hypothetical protein
MVSFNDVTKKPAATIDLRKVLSIEDNNLSTSSGSDQRLPTSRSRESVDSVYAVERSFRLTFADKEEINFFTDTDEEKAQWYVNRLARRTPPSDDIMSSRLYVLQEILRRIPPPHPLWAEAIWQRQQTTTTDSALPTRSSGR